jgi:hypothetical protein
MILQGNSIFQLRRRLLKGLSKAWNPSRQGLFLLQVFIKPMSALFLKKTKLLAKLKKSFGKLKVAYWGDGDKEIKGYRNHLLTYSEALNFYPSGLRNLHLNLI